MAPPPRKLKKSLESFVRDRKNKELKSIIAKSGGSDLTDTFGNTLLHFAAKYNNIGIINFLLKSNHQINPRNSSGSTPLFTASKYCSFEAVKILLNANADIFATNATEQTILGVLIEQGMPYNVFQCFLRAIERSGANVDTVASLFLKANCSLEMVLSMRNARVTREVLKRMTTIESAQSESAIRVAMRSIDLENIFVLLYFGPGKDSRITLFFENLVSLAKSPDINLKTFETFVSVIGGWDIVHKEILECFHELFISASEDVIRVLLNYEVDVIFKEELGVDLIAGVFSNPNVDVVELLKNRRFNVDAQGFRKLSALHFAVRSQSEKYVQFLIDHGADVNIRDETGKTPIMDNHAWDGNCLGRILLQHGANVQAIDNAGLSVDQIKNFIIPQMSILEARGVTIDPRHLVLLNSAEYVNVYQLCSYQCERLKEFKLTQSVSLLDVLTEDTEKIAAELGDEDFTRVVDRYRLENGIIDYYRDSLEMKLKRAMIVYRSKRKLAGIVMLFTQCDVGVDHLVVRKIFGLLRYWDMCAFV